jgi:uncharacterized repeat protein (TIGR01451 family)
MTLATFRAVVHGQLNQTCRNTVQGYSPDTFIVKRTDLAPVVVLVPFQYNKTVNPTSVVLGGQVQYTAQEFNIGTTPAHMYKFEDSLPSGFKYQGSSIYSQTVDLVLQPNHGNTYQTTFAVDVLGTPEPCDNLPRLIYQVPGTIRMGIDAPPELAGTWSNAANAAGVTVYPQATASKSSIHRAHCRVDHHLHDYAEQQYEFFHQFSAVLILTQRLRVRRPIARHA